MTAAAPQLDSRRGWLVVLAAAASMFSVFGVAYSFGAFFSSMAETFDASSGATALVFSFTVSLSFVLGLHTGRLADRHGPRPVLLFGAASLVIGLVATSRVGSLTVGYLTYAPFVGAAVACGYVPMVAMVGGWFDRLRTTALGVAVAGIGAGTLVGSPLAAALIDRHGWRTTYVLMAVGGGSLMVLAALVATPGPAAVTSPKPRALGELLRIDAFRTLYLATALTTFGLFVPFVFIARYAEEQGISDVAAASLVGIIGGASVIGRLGLGALAGRLGTLRLYLASFITMAASHLLWLGASASFPVLAVYAAVLGLGYGGFIALSPAVVAEIFGLDGLGGVIGTLYTAAAIGSLAGPPVAGVLFDTFGSTTAIVFALALSTGGAIVLAPLLRSNDERELSSARPPTP